MSHPTRRRIATVLLAPIVALVTWAFIRFYGIDLVVTTGDGTVGPADVFAVALVGAAAGWLVVLLLERRIRHPRPWWTFIGSTGLAVSTIGPSYFADGASAIALITLHIVTAVGVIVGFAGTLPVHRSGEATRCPPWWPCSCGYPSR